MKPEQETLIALCDEITRLRGVVAAAYQIVGSLAHYAGMSDTDAVIKALDDLSEGDTNPNVTCDTMLPFCPQLPPLMPSGDFE